MASGRSDLGDSLAEAPSPQVTLGLCQADSGSNPYDMEFFCHLCSLRNLDISGVSPLEKVLRKRGPPGRFTPVNCPTKRRSVRDTSIVELNRQTSLLP